MHDYPTANINKSINLSIYNPITKNHLFPPHGHHHWLARNHFVLTAAWLKGLVGYLMVYYI